MRTPPSPAIPPPPTYVINNLNTVLGTVDEKGAQFDASVDQLQKLLTGLAQGRDPIAGAIQPLATAENDLTDMLQKSRRPVQGVIENVRPFAQRFDEYCRRMYGPAAATMRELIAFQIDGWQKGRLPGSRLSAKGIHEHTFPRPQVLKMQALLERARRLLGRRYILRTAS